MPHLSIRVSEQERALMESYAKMHGMSLSEAIKAVFLEKLEDEYDIQLIREYEADPDQKTFSHADVKKILGLK